MSATAPLLRVEDLRVEFVTEDGIVHAVDGITYQVDRGRTLGIVGESGSGKTVSSLTTLGLTRQQGARISGRVSRSVLQEVCQLIEVNHRSGQLNLRYSGLHGVVRFKEGIIVEAKSGTETGRIPRCAPISTRTSSRAACASAR